MSPLFHDYLRICLAKELLPRNQNFAINDWRDARSIWQEFCKQGDFYLQQQLDEAVQQELSLMTKLGVWGLCPEDPSYPQSLKNFPDAPLRLYGLGDVQKLQHSSAVSIVGTRLPTEAGRQMAYRIARETSALSVPVISGLARGIDSAAHQGALDEQGGTVAVLGCGLAQRPQASLKAMVSAIEQQGCLISEFSLNQQAARWTFPRRNRIISALGLGAVVIVEGALRSGSMITARNALEQGRTLYAVPGLVSSVQAQGPNALIQKGQARLLQSVGDIQALQTATESGLQGPKDRASAVTLPEGQQDVYKALSQGVLSLDQLHQKVQKNGLTLPKLVSILTLLQAKRLVKQLPGQRFCAQVRV